MFKVLKQNKANKVRVFVCSKVLAKRDLGSEHTGEPLALTLLHLSLPLLSSASTVSLE